MEEAQITIITPTTGKKSLYRLNDSLEEQSIRWVHLLLWDDKREGDFLFPDPVTMEARKPHDMDGFTDTMGCRQSIVMPGSMVQGRAAGSALRAIGLMAVNTPYVTFADDDVWYDPNHLESLIEAVQGRNWAYCRRKVWANENELIGIDNFESVGDDPSRKVPYEMTDNNTMIFTRRLGTSGAVLYRETKDYNDDRLMYGFLKQHGGEPGKIKEATVNQICPSKLEKMFREYCDNGNN
jgi:hypothetical protein